MDQPVEILNPVNFLKKLEHNYCSVWLKWEQLEYRGYLNSFDKFMNFELLNAKEYQDGVKQADMGQLLIRCNNVLFITKCDEEESDQAEATTNGTNGTAAGADEPMDG